MPLLFITGMQKKPRFNKTRLAYRKKRRKEETRAKRKNKRTLKFSDIYLFYLSLLSLKTMIFAAALPGSRKGSHKGSRDAPPQKTGAGRPIPAGMVVASIFLVPGWFMVLDGAEEVVAERAGSLLVLPRTVGA